MIRARLAAGYVALVLGAFLLCAFPVRAQESLSVSVTPPLFQLTIGPGESWTSTIKVINNNPYDVYYAPEVVDFEAQGETGQGKFVPLVESFANQPQSTNSLGSWIEISKDPVLIKAGESKQIDFTVRVPLNAEPGGHYAAIMVGPHEDDTTSGTHMKVTSFVTSLLMVRIKGDVVESGRIREFTTDESLYQKPEAKFVLRFENTGNTHLRPQGSIVLYNMWGKERGTVEINEEGNFGNVLPKSIRRFEFSWSGDRSPFDIGRYSAVVTLAYGDDNKQNTTATTYFWVVPVVPVAITLGIVLGSIFLLMWFIRRYIRRALSLERERRGLVEHPNVPDRAAHEEIAPVPTFKALVQPLREGVVDLRSVRTHAGAAIYQEEQAQRPFTAGQFFAKYRLFFAFLAILAVLIIAGSLYFAEVLVPHRDFEIHQVKPQDEKLEAAR